MLSPPFQATIARYTQGNAGNVSGTRCVCSNVRPVKKSHFGAGAAIGISVEEMVRRDIILVDGLLDESQPKRLRIKGKVALCIGCNGGNMVQSIELIAKPRRVNGRRRSA